MPLKHTVEEIKFDNGIKGLLINVPDATVVSYNINFRAGNNYADFSTEQTAHVLEHLVSSGVGYKFPAPELFSQEFTKNGARCNAHTDDYSLWYDAESAIMEWDRILDLMKIEITEPIFSKDYLESEKGNVRGELASNLNNYERVVYQSVRSKMGIKRCTENDALATVDNIQLEDVIHFYKNTHTLRNMRFVLVGNLLNYKQQIINKFNDWNLPEGELLPVIKFEAKTATMSYLERDIPNLVFNICIALNRILSLDELLSMYALNHILTGSFHSRIFGEARRRGICYQVRSGTGNNVSGIADWGLYGHVKPENADELFKLINEQLYKVISDDISDEEIYAAKQYVIGNYQMKGQTVKSLDDWYSSHYYKYDQINDMDQYLELVNNINRQAMVKLAKEFIDGSLWSMGIIGKASDQQLETYDGYFLQLFNGKIDL